MNLIYNTRVVLINIGKMLPFLLCTLVLISYSESGLSLMTENFIAYDGEVLLYKPISWFIGSYFEYNAQMLVVLIIISIAIETCVWNKLSCIYLGFNLFEKDWFANHEYDTEIYYIVIAINILICAYLIYKGLKQILP